jgi:hypothetical protein
VAILPLNLAREDHHDLPRLVLIEVHLEDLAYPTHIAGLRVRIPTQEAIDVYLVDANEVPDLKVQHVEDIPRVFGVWATVIGALTRGGTVGWT